MQESENEANKITNFSASFHQQPEQDLETMYIYRNVIHNLSKLLIDTNWRKLKRDSAIIATMEEQLRDAIKNLEQLSNTLARTKAEIDIHTILSELFCALVELYKAADLLEVADIQVSSSSYENLVACWNHLNLARVLMQQD